MNYCYYIFTPNGVNYFLQYLLLIFFRGQTAVFLEKGRKVVRV